jgi:hypothetical protein
MPGMPFIVNIETQTRRYIAQWLESDYDLMSNIIVLQCINQA